jgi:hypothetical protein
MHIIGRELYKNLMKSASKLKFDFEYWKVIYTQKLKEIALNNDSRAVQYGYATD